MTNAGRSDFRKALNNLVRVIALHCQAKYDQYPEQAFCDKLLTYLH